MTAIEIIKMAQDYGYSKNLLDRVLEAGDPELAYRLAYLLEDAEMDALEPIILRSTHPRLLYDFALIKAERGGDVSQLEAGIIAAGDAGLMILFAADIQGADIDRLEQAIRLIPDSKYLNLFEAEMRIKGHDG